MSLTLIPTKLLFNLSWQTVNLFSQCESQLTVLPLYVYPAGTWFFAFLGREQTKSGGVKKMYSFQYTSRSAFLCVPAPNWSRCLVSSVWNSSQVSPIDLQKPEMGYHILLLPPWKYRVPQYVLIKGNFLNIQQSTPKQIIQTSGYSCHTSTNVACHSLN